MRKIPTSEGMYFLYRHPDYAHKHLVELFFLLFFSSNEVESKGDGCIIGGWVYAESQQQKRKLRLSVTHVRVFLCACGHNYCPYVCILVVIYTFN